MANGNSIRMEKINVNEKNEMITASSEGLISTKRSKNLAQKPNQTKLQRTTTKPKRNQEGTKSQTKPN